MALNKLKFNSIENKCKDLKFKYFDDPLQFEIGKLEENVAKYVST